ncbi:hypothetical protein T08_12332, partial [Trichinella sp. T8]
LDPDRSPRRGRYTLSTLNYTVHLPCGRTNERLVNSKGYPELILVPISPNSAPFL